MKARYLNIKFIFGLCSVLSGVALPSVAQAYCRTTTCDPNVSCDENPNDCCIYVNNCDTNGRAVSWPSTCVSYNSQKDGSQLRNISQSQLEDVLETAFNSWLSVSCDGEPLSLSAEDRGVASCGAPEFNKENNRDKNPTNANIWMFQDDPNKSTNISSSSGGIDASSLAVSVITFDANTAELVDVDVEFNSASAAFTVDDTDINVDLLSVATHETGHFLGLEHSLEPGSTMRAYYKPPDTGPRSLSQDDEDAICAVYPADRELNSSKQTCEPYGSYSPQCYYSKPGCSYQSLSSSSSPSSPALWGASLLALFFARRRKPPLAAHGPRRY